VTPILKVLAGDSIRMWKVKGV